MYIWQKKKAIGLIISFTINVIFLLMNQWKGVSMLWLYLVWTVHVINIVVFIVLQQSIMHIKLALKGGFRHVEEGGGDWFKG